MLAPLFPTWLPLFVPNQISAERIWRDKEVRAFQTSGWYINMGIDGSGAPFYWGPLSISKGGTNMQDHITHCRLIIIIIQTSKPVTIVLHNVQ
jgi:hypothetical protein